ncbi:hypothetical protein SDRG_03908 [Saprolegnia diclina VS20]|uniref:Uncharacterized protein n=1 Tax=Saprolegnia diclina (strain VS20) TaxID=1156394 RepID=T0S245_SAPDV|nr:hypothetical protein SDRG_03908 [Saprolegnia diclina VS20]EQC38953.1 hypothetical protein SDRG_03908 [Saprolegnia diclina VS20]|eukprot:XP_008607777.1 hypothetical protein SDRG_03908 [Saprolegnia diclina VS20]
MSVRIVMRGATAAVVYAALWLDRAPRCLFSPKRIETAAHAALTTKKEIDEVAEAHDDALIRAKAPLSPLGPLLGLLACLLSLEYDVPDASVPCVVVVFLYCACKYIAMVRSELLLQNEQRQWKDWRERMVDRLAYKAHPDE